ncbi:MAG TPA: polysaccharide pyruvyl transferase family protein [Crinalium sp.]|jgi:polysaccharide pyruvyl transferase WcaK-like protein
MNSVFMQLESAAPAGRRSSNLIFYIAQTQYTNLGDLIINKTLIERLRHHGKLIIDDRGVPDWYCQELGLSADERASFYGMNALLLAWLCSFRALFQRQLNTYLIIPPGHASSREKWVKPKILGALIYFALLRLVGGRICRFGVSIGPFSKARELAEIWNSKMMYFYSVRDSLSERYAHQMGINKVRYFPDLAWLLAPHPKADIDPSDTPITIEGEYVIFSFRKKAQTGITMETYGDEMYDALDVIAQTTCGQWGKTLVLSYQVDSDYYFCKELQQRYGDRYKVVLVDQKIDSRTMYELYSRASMVFSNRLHALMFGLICGSLPVAVVDVEKNRKVVGILLDAGLKHLILNIEQGADLANALPAIAAEADLIKEKLILYREQTVKAADDSLKSVFAAS